MREDEHKEEVAPGFIGIGLDELDDTYLRGACEWSYSSMFLALVCITGSIIMIFS